MSCIPLFMVFVRPRPHQRNLEMRSLQKGGGASGTMGGSSGENICTRFSCAAMGVHRGCMPEGLGCVCLSPGGTDCVLPV